MIIEFGKEKFLIKNKKVYKIVGDKKIYFGTEEELNYLIDALYY